MPLGRLQLVAPRQRTGLHRAALRHQQNGFDDRPAKVQVAAGFPRTAGLGPKLGGHNTPGRLGELCADEPGVALTLDVADDPPGLGVGGDHLMTAQRGPLRVQGVLGVLEPQGVVGVDVDHDLGVEGPPDPLAGQPGGVPARCVS